MKIKEKIKTSYFIPSYVIAIYIVLSFIFIDLPGLYLDAVNPDYMGLHMLHSENVPAWAFSDNVIATWIEGNTEYSHFPVLNSLYGTCFEMYSMILWAIPFGYSIIAIRTSHILYGLILLLGIYFLLKYILNSKEKASIGTFLFVLEPSFIFSSRTQYYIQLFPHLFFLFGLLLVLKSLFEHKNQKKYSISGFVLIGLSACSYFVFAFYFLAVFITYIVILIIKKNHYIKNGLFSILGFLIGYIPFLYGHISIILTQGMDGWISALKGLNIYGISDGLNTSLGQRFFHIAHCIGDIVGGNSIINMMTGADLGTAYGKMFALLYLIAVVISIFLVIVNRRKLSESKRLVSLMVLVNILIMHCVLGLLIGNSLGYQHFIMLMPIMYITIYLLIMEVHEGELGLRVNSKKMFKIIGLSLSAVLIIVSLKRDYEGYNQIVRTEGISYYSDAINDIAYYLEGVVDEDDTVISPQWGYWMQIACITNGQVRLWIDTDRETLQSRLDMVGHNDKYFVIVDNNTDIDMIEELMQTNGYNLCSRQSFIDFGDILEPQVLVYEPK